MGLRDIETTLPPGFRFYPSDEELVCHYLYNKVTNQRSSGGTMVEVDLHTREPWELPEVAKLSANEWYFFSFRDRKYATGSRTNRATKSGYWKATGKDRTVYDPSSHAIVGMRKTLVFYRGRAPNGIKSGWVMHEFRLENPQTPPKEDWVLCRVFHKRKGEEENMRSHSPTADSSPPLMADHATAAEGSSYGEMVTSFPNFVPQCQEVYSPNPFFNVALMQCNLLDLPQEVESSSSMMGMGSRNGQDHCGLFLDVGFDEDHGMEEEVGFGNFGGMRFQSG